MGPLLRGSCLSHQKSKLTKTWHKFYFPLDFFLIFLPLFLFLLASNKTKVKLAKVCANDFCCCCSLPLIFRTHLNHLCLFCLNVLPISATISIKSDLLYSTHSATIINQRPISFAFYRNGNAFITNAFHYHNNEQTNIDELTFTGYCHLIKNRFLFQFHSDRIQ